MYLDSLRFLRFPLWRPYVFQRFRCGFSLEGVSQENICERTQIGVNRASHSVCPSVFRYIMRWMLNYQNVLRKIFFSCCGVKDVQLQYIVPEKYMQNINVSSEGPSSDEGPLSQNKIFAISWETSRYCYVYFKTQWSLSEIAPTNHRV
jgi:hypothetical protein